MSRAMNHKAGSKSQKKNPAPLRIMVKCMWNGERVALPPPGSSDKITSRTTLSHLIFTIGTQNNANSNLIVAAARTEGTLALQHMRTMVPQSEWETTTLADIGVENSMGSALLTLHNNNNPTNTTSNNTSSTPMATKPVAPERAMLPPPPPVLARVAATTTDPEPMNVEEDTHAGNNNNEDATTQQVWTTQEAVDLLLQSNFDVDSKVCITTLLKLLDNIISSTPSDVKYRTLNLDNEALQKRIFSKRGGLEFVQACGFARTVLSPQLSFSLKPSSSSPNSLELVPSKESLTDLQAARRLLVERAVRVLEMDTKDLPKAKPPRTATATTSSSSSSSFDPYKTHNFNAQAAALGAPNPLTGDREPSRTESQLQALKSKQERLERKLHTHLIEREWVATRPGAVVPPPLTAAAATSNNSGGGGSGDGSLLAAQMKRRQEERKKREEGGFTTQAMRDLEQMKKSKVYSHVQLRINFSDGSYVTGKFLPKETLETVRQVLLAEVLISESSYAFDLYVAPPRRKLDWSKTLQEEGLVPAAKLHVSWKVGGAPTSNSASGTGDVGSFIQPALFMTNNDATSFPDAKSIVQSRTLASQTSTNSSSSTSKTNMTAEEKEAAMMRRMLGQKPKLKTTKRPSSDNDDSKKPAGTKPTWFKK